MIPIRVPALALPTLATDRRFNIKQDHPLFDELCPVCDVNLGNRECVMILAGIEPEDRKESGYTTGAGVMVHSDCAGYPVRNGT